MSQPQIHIPDKIIHRNNDDTVDTYICNEEIGRGGYAIVYRVTDKKTNHSYAMKVFSKSNITFRKLQKEIQIQQNLNHQNIVKLYNSFSDEFNHYLILEYCPGKTIYEYLKKSDKGYLTEPETRKILNDILHGLVYLHNLKIIHHDLKLENFIIGDDGRVKIADFGISTVLKYYNDKSFSFGGTINYLSPELFQKENKGHGFEVDIWAVGVAAFKMLTGQYPFNGSKKEVIYEKIKNFDFRFPSKIQLSTDAKNFIKKIFRIDPRKRPTATDLLEHPFLSKYDKEKIILYKASNEISNKIIQSKFAPQISNNRNFYVLNNRCNCYYLGNSYNNNPIIKPIISNEMDKSLKSFNFNNVYQFENDNNATSIF